MRPATLLIGIPMLTFVAACGDATGVQPEDLAGTWRSTTFEFTSKADPSLKADLAAQGVVVTFEIRSDGAITITQTEGGNTSTDSGTISVTGNAVTIVSNGDPASGTIERDGDTLTLNLTDGPEFDFDGDGSEEPATVLAVFSKTG